MVTAMSIFFLAIFVGFALFGAVIFWLARKRKRR